jgi:hypothetical protein
LSWNDVWRQETGILFYFSDVGLGTSDGYSATYSSGYRTLYLSVITDEQEATVGELPGVVADPTRPYRLVVSSHDGATFLFQFFDKVDLDNPWCSAICQDPSSTYTSGYCGLFVFEQTYPSAVEGAEATFDNYQAAVPPVGAMPATVTDLSPPPGGKTTTAYPTVAIAILDRDTSVDPASITLSLDDVLISSSALTIEPLVHKPNNPASGPREFSGATVTYPITALHPWGSRHTNRIVFADNTGARHTNTWMWTAAYPYLPAATSLPLGSLTVRGFDARMVQSANDGATLDNTLERARQQLALPPLIPVDLSATSIVEVLSWAKTGTPTNVPGLCPGTYLNIAVESSAYLELSPGVHRFRIDTDDRAGVYAGLPPGTPQNAVLWENPNNTANATFEFVVEAAGLYPIRVLWEETGGDAHLHLHSVDLMDLSETRINDPTDPPGVVRAYYPLVCRSAALVTGPYAVEPGAAHTLNTVELVGADCSPAVVGRMVTGGTFTFALPDATRFYRLDGPRRTRITEIDRSGPNLVLRYSLE